MILLRMTDRRENMQLRKYTPSDCVELTELFYNTVHKVNAEDYTKEQLDVWAPGKADADKWNQSFQAHHTVVAVENDMIAGFGDIDETGYLDRLYVHMDYQGKGIATAICDELEKTVHGNIITHASITAKPFFAKRGYRVIKEQQVERQGIFLTNYVMEKARSMRHSETLNTVYRTVSGQKSEVSSASDMDANAEREAYG